MNFVSRADNMLIQAMKTGAWRTYILLWFATTLAIAAASFLLVFIPAISWEALAPYYTAFTKGTPVVGMKWSSFMTALQFSELESLINGMIVFCTAPILMSIQYLLGDFDESRKPAPIRTEAPFIG